MEKRIDTINSKNKSAVDIEQLQWILIVKYMFCGESLRLINEYSFSIGNCIFIKLEYIVTMELV